MKWRKYLPILGILIFVYLLIRINIVNILKELSSVNLFLIFIALILTFLLLIMQTFKWFLIARKQKIGVGFGEAFKINLIGNFYGFITPSKLGSVIRVDYLKKYTKNIGKGIGNFVLDKILDISSLFFLAILFVSVFDFLPFKTGYLIFIFIIFIFGSFIFMKKERAHFILKFFYKRFIPRKLKKNSRELFNSFYEDFPRKRFLFFVFLINLLTWLNIYLITYVIGLSLGIKLPFVYFLGILPISTLVAQIPITINGLGTREATMIGLFGLFGIGAAKVFSMSILSLFITGILPALIASFLIFRKDNNQ